MTVYAVKMKKIKKTLPYSAKMLYNVEWCIIFAHRKEDTECLMMLK